MIHRATPSFWRCFEACPRDVQDLARKNFQLLREDAQHPSLHFKKLGNVWSIRVGLRYRALAACRENVFYWHWIGTHAEYDRMLK